MIHPASTFHQAAERSLLRQTAAPNEAALAQEVIRCYCGANKPSQVCNGYCGRPVGPLSDFDTIPGPLARLMREIADEACRVDIECHARFVGDGAHGPVYDTSQLEPGHIDDPEMVDADKRAIERAVQYLDLRGILHRPVAGHPSLVCFARA